MASKNLPDSMHVITCQTSLHLDEKCFQCLEQFQPPDCDRIRFSNSSNLFTTTPVNSSNRLFIKASILLSKLLNCLLMTVSNRAVKEPPISSFLSFELLSLLGALLEPSRPSEFLLQSCNPAINSPKPGFPTPLCGECWGGCLEIEGDPARGPSIAKS